MDYSYVEVAAALMLVLGKRVDLFGFVKRTYGSSGDSQASLDTSRIKHLWIRPRCQIENNLQLMIGEQRSKLMIRITDVVVGRRKSRVGVRLGYIYLIKLDSPAFRTIHEGSVPI